ncbi:hypothetical protein AVEN_268378-1 [Araneus ventricosus]|uniref:Uncharacterized protein n=1 Tax=Araneus ventricosus TaxID=182803 RepID=A0A4Y2LR62_ARAVE|nr:hypothetical protein AVEN_268378-1 [Araneus ventricosus]
MREKARGPGQETATNFLRRKAFLFASCSQPKQAELGHSFLDANGVVDAPVFLILRNVFGSSERHLGESVYLLRSAFPPAAAEIKVCETRRKWWTLR